MNATVNVKKSPAVAGMHPAANFREYFVVASCSKTGCSSSRTDFSTAFSRCFQNHGEPPHFINNRIYLQRSISSELSSVIFFFTVMVAVKRARCDFLRKRSKTCDNDC